MRSRASVSLRFASAQRTNVGCGPRGRMRALRGGSPSGPRRRRPTQTVPGSHTLQGKLTLSPPREVPAARFIGPDQRNKREMRRPKQNDADSADMPCREEKPHGSNTKEGDEILCVEVTLSVSAFTPYQNPDEDPKKSIELTKGGKKWVSRRELLLSST